MRGPILGMMALFLLACGGDDGGDSSGGSGSTTAGSGGGTQAVPCPDAPASLDLGGAWAARGRLAVTLNGVPGGAISICPTDQIGEAGILMLLTIDQSADTELGSVKATLCQVELPVVKALVGTCDPSSPGIVETQIIAPDSFIEALPSVATMPVTGQLDGTDAGAGLTMDRFTVTVGSSIAGDVMPTWNTEDGSCNSTDVGFKTTCEAACVDDCASLRDDDGDEYPGVTVHVCGFTEADKTKQVACNATTPEEPGATLQGKAYIDIQVDPQFTGKAESSCELRGSVDTSVLYNLVGANIYLSGVPVSVTSSIKSLPTFEVDPAQSLFRMVRIDGEYGAPNWDVDATDGAAACATIIEHVNEL